MRSPEQLYEPARKLAAWIQERVIADGRGDHEVALERPPAGRFWLGRLAPEESAARMAGERGERMTPCACGVRFQPTEEGPWDFAAQVRFRVWTRDDDGDRLWRKSGPIAAQCPLEIQAKAGALSFGAEHIAAALDDPRLAGFAARIDVEVELDGAHPNLTVVLVNDSDDDLRDPNLYEAGISVEVGEIEPFVLDSLPDSFRYERTVPAFGVSGGVSYSSGVLSSEDLVAADRPRPEYWDLSFGAAPDLRFETLAADPLPSLGRLVELAGEWGNAEWSDAALGARAAEEDWEEEMLTEARREAGAFEREVGRLQEGVRALTDDLELLEAFKLMNEAMAHAAHGKYESWRPFQVAFQLLVLPALSESGHPSRREVDTLWFATGGGKTETYLGLVVVACLLDRMRGKHSGVTAWSRFPLRMLSLQQMQRFSDALAGAELARRKAGLEGDPIRLGFLVGAAATPNRIREEPGDNEEDADDPEMPDRYRRLAYCPFCRIRDIEMGFNARYWLLEHRCRNAECPWPEEALPIHVVDEEIFRLLPSVVVGTLDKAATIAWQAAMRGLVGSPIARCKGTLHGFRYSPRSGHRGCLVPGCRHDAAPLGQARDLFAPALRIQDELHLLRDSLGAVDSHYETLLDHLQSLDGAPPAKIIASSATLAGHDAQIRELYLRAGRAFPLPGPKTTSSFWTRASDRLMRRYVGLAPRGQTLEYAADRMASVTQREIRRLLSEPAAVAAELEIDEDLVDDLLSLYGTQVVYGSRVRDVEAAVRSFGSEIPVSPLEFVSLTGGTPFDEVREALDRLTTPEPEFEKRIHLVAASSMMSHGVDVDRLNVITMLGLPLTTAEFIQTTARIGRTHPGLVFVLHRMGGERDASIYRAFPQWIEHGDRFIEPVPITRRSRRVLELTYPGAFAARAYAAHESAAVRAGGPNLARAARLANFFKEQGITEEDELAALADALGVDSEQEPELARRLEMLVARTFRMLEEPGDLLSTQLCGERPMTSLRDVEAQVPINEWIPGGARRR